MERKIRWISGLYDEIELVYEKAEENEGIASVLSELEDRALREAEQNCGRFKIKDKPITAEQFRALSWPDKEYILCCLGNDGLTTFKPSLEEPVITVTLSPGIQLELGCTMFSILNKLEKLDGAYNEVRFPKATLELQVPLGGKKGLMKFEMLIMQLYPWLSVRETSTNEMAEVPEEKPVPAAPQPQKPEDRFLDEMMKKTAFTKAMDHAIQEFEDAISSEFVKVKKSSGEKITVEMWRKLPTGDKFSYITTVGKHGITPSTLLCIDFTEIIPYCLAITLLFCAYSGKYEKQLLDTGDKSDIRRFKQAIEELRPCWPQWTCKILTDNTPNDTVSQAPKTKTNEPKKVPMRSKMSNFLRKMADSLSKE